MLKPFFDKIDPLLDKVGDLTKVHLMIICGVTFVFIVGLVYWLAYMPKFEEINKKEGELGELTTKLDNAKRQAKDIEKFRNDMKEAEVEFLRVKKSLPEGKEIPSLLISISRAGHDSNLEFLLFERKDAVSKDFYAEIPIAIRVAGGYHNVGEFFDKVAKLNRIVNMRNIKMVASDSGIKETSCTATTYMFIENPKEEKPKKK
jgi:type IV pilus assembly protein PilO